MHLLCTGEHAHPKTKECSALNAELSPLLLPRDAAKHLGLSEKCLEKWRYRGTGPRYLKLGNRIRYTLKDLTAWAEQNARTSTSV